MTKALSFLVLLSVAVNIAGQKSDAKKKRDPANKYPQSGKVLVKGNLLVLDDQEKYVDGLKPENVKIFEDGVHQPLARLERRVPPLNVGIVADNSGSVRKAIENIIKVSNIVVTNLQDGDGAFVVRFVDSEKIEVFQDYTTSKKDLFEAVENMFVEGGQSAVLDAVFLAAEKMVEWEKKVTDQRFAIVLVTDGEDRNSYHRLDELLSLIEPSALQIYPVVFTGQLTDKRSPGTGEKFGLSNARRFGHTLALKTGGIATFFENGATDETIMSLMKLVFIELRAQYVFSYESTNQKRNGLERRLTVEVADGHEGAKRKGFLRPGFVVPLD